MRALVAAAIAAAILGIGARADDSSPYLAVSLANHGVQIKDYATGAASTLDGVQAASYSYDGTKLVSSTGYSLIVADGDGKNPVDVDVGDAGPPATQPSLAPDDHTIAFIGAGGHVYTIRSDGTGLHQLTGSTLTDQYPVWSPRGDQIAFTRTYPNGVPELYLVNAVGGERQLTFGSPNAYSRGASWSPDGTWLAYNEETYRGNHVELMRPDGSDHRQVSPNFPRWFGYAPPAWSPDGKHIAFVATSAQSVQLIDPDGQNWSTLIGATGYDVNRLSWRPVAAGIAVGFAEVPYVEPARPFTFAGAVRSTGRAAAAPISVALSLTGGAARLSKVTLAGGSCGVEASAATCSLASLGGDADAPLLVTLAPSKPGNVKVVARVTAGNVSEAATGDPTSVGSTVTTCTVLGTDGPDKLRASARGGDTVCGLDGSDVIYARNGKRDYVDGGLGEDTAYVDRVDRVRHVEHVHRG